MGDQSCDPGLYADCSGRALRGLQNHVGWLDCGTGHRSNSHLHLNSWRGAGTYSHVPDGLVSGYRPRSAAFLANTRLEFPWKTILLAVALLVVGVLFTQFLGGKETSLDQIINSSLKARFATAFLAFATAPLVEELIFRGVLYPALQRAIGMVAAVAIVTVLFAGIHVFQYYDNFGVVAVITMLSLSLTLLRARTGRLLPSFVIHLVFNGLQAAYLILQPFVGKSSTDSKPVVGFFFHYLSRLFI